MARVVVVGSINMDMVVVTNTFPRLGETLFGTGFFDESRRQRREPGRRGGSTWRAGDDGRPGGRGRLR